MSHFALTAGSCLIKIQIRKFFLFTAYLTYDKAGNVTEIADALGNITKREYDLAGQLVKLIDPVGNENTFTYSPLGKIETVTNANGDTMAYTYYPGGLIKSVSLPCGETESYEYNKTGNVTKVTDTLGNATAMVYDSLGRVVETVNPLGFSKKFAYDAVGNITGVTDENGNTTQYKYSAVGDVVEVIDPAGNSTKYSYDQMSRLTSLELSNSRPHCERLAKQSQQITIYERNKKGEVIAVTSPLGDIVKYIYDKIGNVVSKLDEDGLETLYDYNLAGKISKVAYADGKTVEFGYNALKQLTEMRDWLGTTKVELDRLGRTTKVTDHDNNEVAYLWNAIGQRERLTYPDKSEVAYSYNTSGKLTEVVAGPDITSYTYDPMGRIAERILPNGTATQYTFNALGAISSLTHAKDGNILDQFKYSYDPAGNITEIDKYRVGVEADNGLFKYSYDPLNRLVEANGNKYAYDALGNRIESLINGTASKHEFNAKNQLIKTFEGDNTTSYNYDKRGNLVEEILNGQQTASYAFDATNMMTQATTTKGNATYGYDGFRNRVRKLENMTDVRFINDITLPYNNLLSMNNQNYTWGNSLISGKDYYLQDHLGSPIRLQGDDRDFAQAFDEFGVPKTDSITSLQNPFGFTGYQTDVVSGLQYAQARYYKPVSGRFLAQDTVCDGLNYYLYCYANPLRFVDRNGLWGTVLHQSITETAALYLRSDHGLDTLTDQVIQQLVDYNKQIDRVGGGRDFLPLIGNQSGYHFNGNLPGQGEDTRTTRANGHLDWAVTSWNNASRIDSILANPNFDLTPHERQELQTRYEASKYQAWQSLGRGLHAIQDIQAHGNIGAGLSPLGHALLGSMPDSRDFIWSNQRSLVTNAEMVTLILAPLDLRDERNPRYLASVNASKEYLRGFFDRINECP